MARRVSLAVVVLLALGAGTYVLLMPVGDATGGGGAKPGAVDVPRLGVTASPSLRGNPVGPDAGEADPPRALAPGTIAGKVTEKTLAVARAEVVVQRRGDQPVAGDCVHQDTQVTGGGGTFATAPLCAGQYDVRARATGRTAMRSVRLGPGERVELELVLLPEGVLEVQVVANDGAAAPGASVSITHAAAGVQLLGETGPRGGVAFEGLQPGRWDVEVARDGSFPASSVGDVRAGKTARVQVRLEAAVSLSGQVVDEEGLGVDGVVVALVRPSERVRVRSARVRARSADGGHFTLGPAQRGTYVALAESAEAVRTPVTLPGPPVRLVVERGTRLEVQLLDQGVRTPGMAVVSTKDGVHAELSVDGGVLVFERVPRGEAHLAGGRISLVQTQWHLGVEEKVAVSGRRMAVDLEVSDDPEAGISGACRLTSGHRLPEVGLFALPPGARRLLGHGRSRAPTPEGLSKLVGRMAFGACEPDGGFALAGLLPGEYELSVEAKSDDQSSRFDQRVTAPATGVEVALPGVAWFRFRVVDGAGQPVTRFGFKPDAIDPYDDGRYESEHFQNEPMLLTIHAPGFQPSQQVFALERGRDLDLGDIVLSRESASLRGRVVSGPSAAPVEGAEVILGESGGTLYATSTDASGAFEFGSIPRLDGELTISHVRHKTTKVRFRVSDEGPLTVRLEPASWVKGRVLTRSGEVPPGLFAAVERGDETKSAWVVDGLFELGPLEAGTWPIALAADGESGRAIDLSAFDVVRVVLPPGEGREVELIERAGGTTFEVEQVDPAGQPVTSDLALVKGRPASKDSLKDALRFEFLEGFSIAPGVFRFRSVPAGEWTLVSDDERTTQPLVVGPQLSPRVRFVVPAEAP